jgi:hypothetical protein
MNEKKSSSSFFGKLSPDMQSVKVDLRRAVFGGCISAVVILAGSWLASGSEAYHLFKTTLPSTRFVCGHLLTGASL